MTRFQILLWLDRYSKRQAYENGAAEDDEPLVTSGEFSEVSRVNLGEASTPDDWKALFGK